MGGENGERRRVPPKPGVVVVEVAPNPKDGVAEDAAGVKLPKEGVD